MIKNSIKILCTLIVLAALIMPTSASISSKKYTPLSQPLMNDFDPLVDNITVTVTIKEIRALDIIDIFSDPDFYVKVTINDQEFTSDVWQNSKYVKNPNWVASCNVPKENEFVNITIALWDKNTQKDRLCDLSPDLGDLTNVRSAELTYSIAAGIWWGDDELGDPSGYGRLNGCDDNSIYQEDRDCVLWFDISQNDLDGDGFPYWLETEVYHTNPLVDNTGEDADGDGIPIEWEYRFGLAYYQWGHDEGYYLIYDPFTWENHTSLDDDKDGLTNFEEYQTWQWDSDPFRQDLFIEIDQMEPQPGVKEATIPLGAYELLQDSHAKYNIVYHVDDGRLGGGEFIPYKADLHDQDFETNYWYYFMHQDANNWRRGVFHWGFLGYNVTQTTPFTFGSRIGNLRATDCFYLPAVYLNSQVKWIPLISSLVRGTFNSEEQKAIVYAGVIMHETGHSLGLYNFPGIDCHDGVWPWQINYWRYGSYKSVMNYRYIYSGLTDYSDGSRGKNDHDDWATIDLTRFNPHP